MDFGALPPEINSARIYSGPGSRPLMQAAAAWQRLANELTATAASYSSVISGLTGDDWLGPSALSMAAAAVPYVAWMRATAASAEQAAAQAVAAANAYESAYAATVPPTVIAANRRTMLSLVKTNVFGQNTPAIATSEAQYGEMWAQDIVAMEGYAGASAAASQLPPFTPPPATTSGAGSLSDAAATAAQAVVPAAAATDVSLLPTLQSFLPPPFDAIPNPIEDLDVLVAAAVAVAAGSLGVSAAQLGEIYRHDVVDEAQKAPHCPAESDQTPAGAAGDGDLPEVGGRVTSPPQPPVAALTGYSANIGGLSVPHSWNLPPAVRQVAAMFPGATPMYMTGSSTAPTPAWQRRVWPAPVWPVLPPAVAPRRPRLQPPRPEPAEPARLPPGPPPSRRPRSPRRPPGQPYLAYRPVCRPAWLPTLRRPWRRSPERPSSWYRRPRTPINSTQVRRAAA